MFSQKGFGQALFLIINYIFPKQNYNVLSGNYDIENTVQDAAIPSYQHRERNISKWNYEITVVQEIHISDWNYKDCP
jgi:hypothetical protein